MNKEDMAETWILYISKHEFKRTRNIKGENTEVIQKIDWSKYMESLKQEK